MLLFASGQLFGTYQNRKVENKFWDGGTIRLLIWVVGDFWRNDAVEDRYSVLIKLVNQAAADGFFTVYNGKRFSPSQVGSVSKCI